MLKFLKGMISGKNGGYSRIAVMLWLWFFIVCAKEIKDIWLYQPYLPVGVSRTVYDSTFMSTVLGLLLSYVFMSKTKLNTFTQLLRNSEESEEIKKETAGKAVDKKESSAPNIPQ